MTKNIPPIKVIVSDEKMQEMIDQYMKNNEEELNELINKKIGVAVRRSISESFTGFQSRSKDMQHLINEKVDKVLVAEINATVIDVNSVQNAVKRKVTEVIRKLDIVIKD